MSFKCGHCRGRHETAAQGRQCAAQRPAQEVERPVRTASTDVPVAPAREAAQGDGFFLVDGVVYKIQWNRAGTRRYASEMKVSGEGADRRGRWAYAEGMMRKIFEDQRMDAADAENFGALYGVCCRCGALLTESAERGIGPICAAKMGF